MWHNEEVECMDTSDSPLCWYYLADCGRWHRFEVNYFHCQCSLSLFQKLGWKKLNKSGCYFLSTLQDDPTNPLQSGNIEKYYLRDPKAVISISSFNCHIKTDFSGICLYLLFHFKSWLTNEEHIWCDLYVPGQQCYRQMPPQADRDESYGASTFREGELKLAIHNDVTEHSLTTSSLATVSLSIVSSKMKVKLLHNRNSSLFPQLFVLRCSSGFLGDGWSNTTISGDDENYD